MGNRSLFSNLFQLLLLYNGDTESWCLSRLPLLLKGLFRFCCPLYSSTQDSLLLADRANFISIYFQGLSSDWNSTVACLDLLLRWFTLRFYDKNTTVHIKSLEYLKSLFEKLIENDYRMSEYEASAFLPHLMIKVCASGNSVFFNFLVSCRATSVVIGLASLQCLALFFNVLSWKFNFLATF